MDKDCVLINPAFIDDSKLWISLNRYIGIYMFLMAHTVRDESNDPLDLYHKYYKNGQSATSMTLKELSGRVGMGKAAISTHLKKLKDAKFIRIDKIKNKNVYVLIPYICNNGLPAFVDGRDLTDQGFEELVSI